VASSINFATLNSFAPLTMLSDRCVSLISENLGFALKLKGQKLRDASNTDKNDSETKQPFVRKLILRGYLSAGLYV